jgi:hypothetical protein
MKKLLFTLLFGLASLAICNADDRYFHGTDSNANSWHSYTDSSGYTHGSDSNDNSFHGYTDSTGYFHGSDSTVTLGTAILILTGPATVPIQMAIPSTAIPTLTSC